MPALAVGSRLEVALRQRGNFLTAACLAPDSGELVGSLAGFLGLAELLRCLEAGFKYAATVEALSAMGMNSDECISLAVSRSRTCPGFSKTWKRIRSATSPHSWFI